MKDECNRTYTGLRGARVNALDPKASRMQSSMDMAFGLRKRSQYKTKRKEITYGADSSSLDILITEGECLMVFFGRLKRVGQEK